MREIQSYDRRVREEAGLQNTSFAVVLGNLAGVVEWADDAWTRLTGFPLDQTIQKPITHFLERAGIEVELVDFVGQHFLEGRPCTLEFPFETFDGRSIDWTKMAAGTSLPKRSSGRCAWMCRKAKSAFTA